jgi:glycerol kinase
MSKYILSIDQGTTSSRAILFTKDADVFGTAQQEFSQHFPQNGWVEHDPNDIWQTVLSTSREVLTKNDVKPEEIIAIGITNQRETTLVWNKKTGKTIYNAIVWQDRRTSDYCESLTTDELCQTISDKTLIFRPLKFVGF